MILTEPVAAFGWAAAGLFALPPPSGRRRFGRIFRAAAARNIPLHWVTRAIAGIGGAVGLTLGSGPLLCTLLVLTTVAVRRNRARRARRHGVECAHLLDGLAVAIAELRVGAHPSTAAAVAARETVGIAAQAFAVGSARSRLGGNGADGLLRPDTVIAAELARVAQAWHVAECHGLALAELLAAARLDLAARITFGNRTRAALAGARATATILAILPVLGIGLGQLMGANPVQVLVHSAVGAFLLPLGAGLACAGLLWADEITHRAALP